VKTIRSWDVSGEKRRVYAQDGYGRSLRQRKNQKKLGRRISGNHLKGGKRFGLQPSSKGQRKPRGNAGDRRAKYRIWAKKVEKRGSKRETGHQKKKNEEREIEGFAEADDLLEDVGSFRRRRSTPIKKKVILSYKYANKEKDGALKKGA